MNQYREIREFFGITQEAFAQLLGGSLALMKKIETGHRLLPPHSVPVFLFLAKEMQRLAQEPLPRPRELSPQFLYGVRRTLQKQKLRLEKPVGQSLKKQNQNQRLILLSETFKENFQEEKYASPLIRMDALKFNAETDLKYWDPEPDMMTRMRLRGIEAMLAFLEEEGQQLSPPFTITSSLV